ncbi:MAG: bifunctional nicotinamidase/pyrazinamidase [Candidatus Hermodarchaeota archaeon]
MKIPSYIPLQKSVSISPKDALIIVDIQNDFLPGGALAVEHGDKIIEGVNQVAKFFASLGARIIFTQDWHPPNHQSFASVYPDKEPFDEFEAPGLGPVLWPDHCVQNTAGADFSSQLETKWAHLIIRKGFRSSIDSYSTFSENDKKTSTGLAGYLKNSQIERVFICGLALDYCVYYSAQDARQEGFEVYVIFDLTRGIDSPLGSIDTAMNDMHNLNVKFLSSNTILK